MAATEPSAPRHRRPVIQSDVCLWILFASFPVAALVLRQDDWGWGRGLLSFLVALLLGLVYFLGVSILSALQRRWGAMAWALLGLGLVLMPVTEFGVLLSRHAYLWRHQDEFVEQVEMAKAGERPSAVAGHSAHVGREPFRVLFRRGVFLGSYEAVVYSPSGDLSDRDGRAPDWAQHMSGDWHWCYWDD